MGGRTDRARPALRRTAVYFRRPLPRSAGAIWRAARLERCLSRAYATVAGGRLRRRTLAGLVRFFALGRLAGRPAAAYRPVHSAGVAHVDRGGEGSFGEPPPRGPRLHLFRVRRGAMGSGARSRALRVALRGRLGAGGAA